MNKVRKQRLLIASFTIVVASIGVALMLYALGSNLNHFYTPSELVSGTVASGQSVRLGGLVKQDSVARAGNNSLSVQFVVTDNSKDVLVSYEGILPDLFREGQGIVVTGSFDGTKVVASQVLAKHDENYMPPEALEAIQKAGHPPPSY